MSAEIIEFKPRAGKKTDAQLHAEAFAAQRLQRGDPPRRALLRLML